MQTSETPAGFAARITLAYACSGVALARWNKKGNIPLRYALRVDDLRPWHVIIATCAACGNRLTSLPRCCSMADRRTRGCATLKGSSAAPAVAIVEATR
jgi:hypothetical protein